MDIGLVANDKFVPLLFAILSSPSSDSELKVRCASCQPACHALVPAVSQRAMP